MVILLLFSHLLTCSCPSDSLTTVPALALTLELMLSPRPSSGPTIAQRTHGVRASGPCSRVCGAFTLSAAARLPPPSLGFVL